MTASPPFKTSPTNPGIGEIHTEPERIADMPYAPAIRVTAPGDLLFISGATASPLYHKHPHIDEEHDHDTDIRVQTRAAMDTIKSILDDQGLEWTDVVKVVRYLTDMRDFNGVLATIAEYMGDWNPASTAICVNQLSSPGARIELEMMAVYPRSK
jgi:2-iminobutanoate/2-iminopropanoate deaminase